MDKIFIKSFRNQIALILYILISMFLSFTISWFVNEYIINYSENYVFILGPANLEKIIFRIFILTIPFYFIINIIGSLKYFRNLKYNFYYIFFSILMFMLIPTFVPGIISYYTGSFFGSTIYTIDLYSVIGFFVGLILEFVLILLILSWIFKKIKK